MRSILAAVLVVGVLAGLTPSPHADAQTQEDWAMEVVGGVMDAIESMAVDADGERIGIAYRLAASDQVGFSLRDDDGTWTGMTEDISGTSLDLSVGKLVHVEGTVWAVAVKEETTVDQAEVWVSEDDGETWTLGFSDDTPSAMTPTGISVAALPSGRIGFAYQAANTGACSETAACFTWSDDYGATWFNLQPMGNRGSPAATDTSFAGGTSVDLYGGVGGFIMLDERGSVANGWVVSSYDGGIWSVMFAADGTACGTTGPSDGETFLCTYFTGTTGSTMAPVGIAAPASGEPLFYAKGNGAWWAYADSQFLPYTGNTFGDCSTAERVGLYRAAVAAHPTQERYIMATECTASPPGVKVWYKESVTATPVESYANSYDTVDMAVVVTPEWFYAFYTNSQIGGRIEAVRTQNPPTPGIGVCETCTVAVDGLNGFDVDPAGQVIITREDQSVDGSTVKTYNAQGMTLLGTAETGCNRADGVAAAQKHVTYADCLNDEAFVSELRIRSHFLMVPEFAPGCTSECDQDPTQGAIEVPANLGQLGRISQNQWDYSSDSPDENQNSSLFCGIVPLSWTFSTTEGHVGVYTVSGVDDDCAGNDDDNDFPYGFVYVAPVVDQMCSWGNSPSLMVAASQQAKTTVFTVAAGTVSISGGVDDSTVKVLPRFSLSGDGAEALAVGCGGDKILVQTWRGHLAAIQANGVGANEETMGETLWATTMEGNLYARGAALSGDGLWGAYALDDDLVIINAETGAPLANFTLPEGNFEGMAMDFTGQNVWVATADYISRYKITEVTTGTEVPCVVDACLGEPDPADRNRDGIPDVGQAGLGGIGEGDSLIRVLAFPGLNDTLSSVVLGLAMAGLAAYAAFLATSKRGAPSPTMMGGAASLALVAAVPLVDFPLPGLVLAGLLAGGIFWMRRGAGAPA